MMNFTHIYTMIDRYMKIGQLIQILSPKPINVSKLDLTCGIREV